MKQRLKIAAVGVALAVVGGGVVAGASPAAAAACAPATGAVGTDTLLTFSGAACTWTVPAGVTAADVLVVAGGGGGTAAVATLSAAGGGAGGLIVRSGFALTPGTSLNVQAGAGGAGDATGLTSGTNGSNSTFGTLVAVGGGAGSLLAGASGGSGGGAGFTVLSGFSGGAGTTGQGYAGGGSTTLGILGMGSGGSGGGSASAASGTTPGAGTSLSISGAPVTYASGGSSLGVANGTIGGGGRATAAVLPAVAEGGAAGTVMVRYRRLVAPVFTAYSPASAGTVGSGFPAYTFAASGYPTPTYAIASGALPAGLSLNGTTGVLSGTPTAAGASVFTVSASNSAGAVTSPAVRITVAPVTTPTPTSTPTPTPTPAPTPAPTPTPTTPPVVVDPPMAVAAAVGVSSFSASWSPVAGATGYTAYRSPGPATCTVSDTDCVIGAVAGTTYTVTVVAHTPDGDSPVSAVSNEVTPMSPPVPDSAPMNAPVTLTTTRGQIDETTPGETVTVVGAGFAAHSTAKVVMYSTPSELGTVTTNAAGEFTLPTTVPQLEAGAHNFVATGVDPDGVTHTLRLPVSVVAETAARAALPLSRTRPVVTRTAGKQKVAGVPCRISSGVVARCVVTATARIRNRTVVVGRGTVTTTAAQGLRQVSVPVKLSRKVLGLTKRPGGAVITFRAVVTKRGVVGTKLVTRTGRVVAKKYTLAHWVHFNARTSKVSRAEARYLATVKSKLAGASVVTCTGHAQESTRARSLAVARKRANAACASLTNGTAAKRVIKAVAEKKAKKKASATARARQRRVDVTVTN